MATPNRHNHEFTTQRRKDSAYPTNPSRNTFCSTLINQTNQALTRDTNFLGSENPSVFGTSGGGRNEEATGSPEESPQFGTTGNGSLGSKKRKEAPNEAQDEGREAKRTRRNKRVLDRQQERIQVTTSFLLTRPGLRVVPQLEYQCVTSQRYWTPLPSIEFKVRGVEGVRLTDAMDAYFDGPDSRDESMFTNGKIGNSVSFRICFDGYQKCKFARQIPTKNYQMKRRPIDGKKLAHNIAKCTKAYLKELEKAGTPFYVPFEDMFLVRFIHVARGSWQPEIWSQVAASSSP